jgi:hypothetical protein
MHRVCYNHSYVTQMRTREQVAEAFQNREVVALRDVLAVVEDHSQAHNRRSWHKAGGLRLGSEMPDAPPTAPVVPGNFLESKQQQHLQQTSLAGGRGRRHVQPESKVARGSSEGKQADVKAAADFVPGGHRPQAIDPRTSMPAGGKKVVKRDDSWQPQHLREVLANKLVRSQRLVDSCVALDLDEDAVLSRAELKQALKSVGMKASDETLTTVIRQCAAHRTGASSIDGGRAGTDSGAGAVAGPTGLGAIGWRGSATAAAAAGTKGSADSSDSTAGDNVTSGGGVGGGVGGAAGAGGDPTAAVAAAAQDGGSVRLEEFLWTYAPQRYGNGVSGGSSNSGNLPELGRRRVHAVLQRRLAHPRVGEAIVRRLWAVADAISSSPFVSALSSSSSCSSSSSSSSSSLGPGGRKLVHVEPEGVGAAKATTVPMTTMAWASGGGGVGGDGGGGRGGGGSGGVGGGPPVSGRNGVPMRTDAARTPSPASSQASRDALGNALRIALADNGVVLAASDHANLLSTIHAAYSQLSIMSFLQVRERAGRGGGGVAMDG